MRSTTAALAREARVPRRARHQEASGLLEAPTSHRVAETKSTLVQIDEIEIEALLPSEPDEAPDAGQPPHLQAARLLHNDVAAAPKLRDKHSTHSPKDNELPKATQAKTTKETRQTRDGHVLPR